MTLALKAFCHEVQVQADEAVSLRLVLDFRAIDFLECLLDRSMDELLDEMLEVKPHHGLTMKFILAMSRKHHSDLTADQIAGFVYDPNYGPAAGQAIGDLIRRAFHVGDVPAEGEQRSRPPKRSRGASRGSSRNGSRQA